MDSIAREADSNQSSMRINLCVPFFSSFFGGMDSEKQSFLFYLPSPASSLFLHLLVTASVLIKANLKMQVSAGLLISEV